MCCGATHLTNGVMSHKVTHDALTKGVMDALTKGVTGNFSTVQGESSYERLKVNDCKYIQLELQMEYMNILTKDVVDGYLYDSRDWSHDWMHDWTHECTTGRMNYTTIDPSTAEED